MESWQDRDTVKKGSLGEKIVEDYLANLGKTVYKPVTDNAHGFDRLISTKKANFAMCEVKAKARRKYYPDTGIDIRSYNTYKSISQQHNLPVYLYFVDEILKQIYGGLLSDMEQYQIHEYKDRKWGYPLREYGIIYFFQPAMEVIYYLSDEEVEELKGFSTRNYDEKLEV